MIRYEFPDKDSFWAAKRHIESLAPEIIDGMSFVEIDFPELFQQVRRVGVSIGYRSLEMEFYGKPEDVKDLLHDCTTGVEEAVRVCRPSPITL